MKAAVVELEKRIARNLQTCPSPSLEPAKCA